MTATRYGEMKILTGNASPLLAQKIATVLDRPLISAHIGKFADGETRVEIQEDIRGTDVFIIQPTCPPVNDNLIELLVMIDACKRASAARVTAVIPYFGYARQDRKASPRAPITAKLAANMLTAAGVNRVLTLDLHAAQIQGFFDIPLDNLHAAPVLANDIREKHGTEHMVIVSPDVGGVARARSMARRLSVPLVVIDKRRDAPNQASVMNIIGNVEGRKCVIVDDMIDTASTVGPASEALLAKGATGVAAYMTHGLFSGPAVERITDSAFEEVVVTDSVWLSNEAKASPKVRIVSIVDHLAEAIRRVANEDSISALYQDVQADADADVKLVGSQ